MRIHRITLRNWRGVEERDTAFVDTGVTVVEGPNESGKSSIVEALDTLFSERDDTKKQAVLSIKAVHNDLGAEVEAEIETGPYRFTYFKRFHRKPATTLSITRPSPENLSGREAHERVRQILDETLDAGLWSAMRIEQGQTLAQADLAKASSLAAALDQAAGVTRTGDTEETLYAAAKAEVDRYFTAGGSPKKETTALEEQVRRLSASLEDDRKALSQLEQDVARSATLDRDSVAAQGAAAESKQAEAEHTVRLREIERAAVALREKKAVLELSRQKRDEAARQAADRELLVQEAATAETALRALAEAEDLTGPAFERATDELRVAEDTLRRATDDADVAERRTFACQQEFELQRDSLDLATLRERNERIRLADAAAADATALLAVNNVSDEALAEVRAAHLELEKSLAALTAGVPELRLVALSDITPTIDGRPTPLSARESFTHSVTGSVALVLPGVAEIEIRSGASGSNLKQTHTACERNLAAVCRRAGVDSPEAAADANAAWRAARGDVEARDRVVKADLRDLTREQLRQKIENLQPRVTARLAARDASSSFVVNFEGAQDAHRAAEEALKVARTARTAAEKNRDVARATLDRLNEGRAAADLARARADGAVKETTRRLAVARDRATDAELVATVKTTAEHFAEAERAHHLQSEAHAALDPATATLLADNAAATRKRAEARAREIEDERIQLRARLQERGEAGLAERCDATASELLRADNDLKRRNVHAAAARLLFDTLDAERTSSRQAYVAPLRAQIESLGRVVYGPSFAVDLNEALQVTARTLDGRTVPFDSLSGGAREQLGVIGRLACAMTVATDGGVPVIFDDTLGNTDPTRIEAMGALLALAGKRCQVIVLTCVPDRFRHIGGATVVRA